MTGRAQRCNPSGHWEQVPKGHTPTWAAQSPVAVAGSAVQSGAGCLPGCAAVEIWEDMAYPVALSG